MASELQLVVFDMAGTTVRDTGHIPQAFVAAFEAHGIRLTHDQVAAVRGASKREAVRRLVAESSRPVDLAPRIYSTFREELERAYERGGISAVDGAEDVIQQLRTRGVRIALNTGLDRDVVDLLLRTLRWSTPDPDADNGSVHVDAVVCGEDVLNGRPAPDLIQRAMALTGVRDPSCVANVGDTAVDIRAGAAAQVRWNIAVCSGAHDRATLAREGPTHLIDSVADLLSVLPLEVGPG